MNVDAKAKKAAGNMAYYCVVTNAVLENRTRIHIYFDVRDNSTTPHTVIRSSDAGFELLRLDATNADGTTMTVAQRRAYLQDQLTDLFTGIVQRLKGADADAPVILANIVGFHVP